MKKGALTNITTKERKMSKCQKKGIPPSVRQMKSDLENASPGFDFEKKIKKIYCTSH